MYTVVRRRWRNMTPFKLHDNSTIRPFMDRYDNQDGATLAETQVRSNSVSVERLKCIIEHTCSNAHDHHKVASHQANIDARSNRPRQRLDSSLISVNHRHCDLGRRSAGTFAKADPNFQKVDQAGSDRTTATVANEFLQFPHICDYESRVTACTSVPNVRRTARHLRKIRFLAHM
jgi:hypothetical protein